MNKIKQSVADKIRWEGGLGEAFWYFGREVNSGSGHFDQMWRQAYDAIMQLEALMPEEGVEE